MVKVLILGGLVWLNSIIDNPIISASIYSISILILSLFVTQNILQIIINTVLVFVLSLLYFWMLKRYSGWMWWIVLVGGALIGLV